MLKYQRLLEQLSVSDDDTGNSTSASSDGNVDASPRMQLNTMYYASSEEDSTSSLTSSDTCDESAASYCRATSLHHNNRPPNVLPFVSPASSPDQHSPLRFSVNSSPSHQRTARRPSASASTSACCGMAPKLHGQLPPSTNRMGPSSVSESTPLQSSGAALTSSGAPDTITASTTHLIKLTSTTEEIQLHKCTSSSSSMDSATDYGSVSETPSAMRERWLRCEPLFGPVVVSECGSAVTSGRSSRRTSWFSGQPAPPVLTTPFAKRRDLQRAGELFARRRRMFGHCGVRKPHTATASSPMVCPVNSSFASTARDVPHRTCPTNLAVTVRLGSPIKPTEQRCSLPPVAPKSSPGSPNGPPSTPGRGRQLCAMVDDDDDDDAERLIDWG